MEVVASLSQGRTAAAQCGLFTYRSVPVIFEPPCINDMNSAHNHQSHCKIHVNTVSFRRLHLTNCFLLSQFHPKTRHALLFPPLRAIYPTNFISFICLPEYVVGRDSSVGIATHHGLCGAGIESRWGGEISRTRPDGPWGQPSLLYNWYRVFTGSKAAGAWR